MPRDPPSPCGGSTRRGRRLGRGRRLWSGRRDGWGGRLRRGRRLRRRRRRLRGLLRRRGAVFHVPPGVTVSVAVSGRRRDRRRGRRRDGDRWRLDHVPVAVAVAVPVPVPMAIAVLLAGSRRDSDEYRGRQGEDGNGSHPGPLRGTAHVPAIGIRAAVYQQPCRARYERPTPFRSSLVPKRAGRHELGRRRRACGRGCARGCGPCSPPARGPKRSACNASRPRVRAAPSAASA
jgi:hypothetical protein